MSEIIFVDEPAEFSMENVDWNDKGEMIKRKGYKTFRGMVHQLKIINKRYNKRGFKGRFTIDLPLKP